MEFGVPMAKTIAEWDATKSDLFGGLSYKFYGRSAKGRIQARSVSQTQQMAKVLEARLGAQMVVRSSAFICTTRLRNVSITENVIECRDLYQRHPGVARSTPSPCIAASCVCLSRKENYLVSIRGEKRKIKIKLNGIKSSVQIFAIRHTPCMFACLLQLHKKEKTNPVSVP